MQLDWFSLPQRLSPQDAEKFASASVFLEQGIMASLPRKSVVALICGETVTSLAAFVFLRKHECIPVMLPPDWTDDYLRTFHERYAVGAVIKIDENALITYRIFSEKSDSENDLLPADAILLSTGGSTGFPKFCIHTEKSLSAPVAATKRFFSCKELNMHSVLPLYHISGFMPVVRAVVSGGNLLLGSYRNLVSLQVPGPETFISLVPTQLARIMEDTDAVERLSGYRAVLIGGAKADNELLRKAKERGIPVSPCFGMTETAAFFAAIRPEDFSPEDLAYRVLGHADVRILKHDEDLPTDDLLNERIAVRSKALFLGYWGEDEVLSEDTLWVTQDDGFFDSNGRLHVTGRSDAMIVSGGKKISPAEVSASLMESGFVKEVKVFGIPDAEWGQKLVCVFVPTANESWGKLSGYLQRKLPSYKVPKAWISLQAMPYDERGKLTDSALSKLFRP